MGTPQRKTQPPKLSDGEWLIMKPFWNHGAMAARDLFAALPPDHGWTYRTVKTMLGRLVRKGALTYDRVGNSYLYQAAWGREEFSKAETASFVHRIFDGALHPLLLQFAKTASPEAIRRARLELERLERQNRRGGSQDA